MSEENVEKDVDKTAETNDVDVDSVEGKHESQEDKTSKNVNHMIPKERLDKEINKRKTVEQTLNDLVDEMVQDVPEEYQEIILDLAPSEKIKWIRNAQNKGLFGGNQSKSGPDAKQPSSKKPVDFSNMSATEKIEHGLRAK